MGKGELMGLPVHIESHIEEIVGASVRLRPVFSAVKHTQLPSEVFKFRIPGLYSVERHVRVAAHLVIHHFRLPAHVKHGMGFPESDEKFHKIVNIAVGL